MQKKIFDIASADGFLLTHSPEEQKALCKVLKTYKRKGYAAMLLMMETGLRAGETLALRQRDVQFANKRLFVRATVVNHANRRQSFVQDSPKSHFSNRTIPLTPRAIEILLHQPQETEWVFPTHNGERLSYEALRYQTICACMESGVWSYNRTDASGSCRTHSGVHQ